MSGPPKGPNTVPVIIRMPADLHAAVKARAAAEERSMAATIRRAIRLWVEPGAPPR